MPAVAERFVTQSNLKKLRTAWTAAVIAGTVSPAVGQVTVSLQVVPTYHLLHLHSSDGQQSVGSAGIRFPVDDYWREYPAAWNANSSAYDILPRPENHGGEARALGEGYIAGYTKSRWGESTVATLWVGAERQIVSLNPDNEPKAVITAAYQNYQGGFIGSADVLDLRSLWRQSNSAAEQFVSVTAQLGSKQSRGVDTRAKAAVWNGTKESYRNLHPVDVEESVILDLDAQSQVGVTIEDGVTRAAKWNGTAESYRNLHPAGAFQSQANAINDGIAVGFVTVLDGQQFSYYRQPISWNEDNEPRLLALPAGEMSDGRANDLLDGIIVGTVNDHAALWIDNGQTLVDLHSISTNPEFQSSDAISIVRDGNNYVVFGTVSESWGDYGNSLAVWSISIPEPLSSCVNLAAVAMWTMARRRSKASL